MKQQEKCEHGRWRSTCKECKQLGTGGSGICEHNRQRSQCKECKQLGTGGSSFCEHMRRRTKCKECKQLGTGGSELCSHERVLYLCSLCFPIGVFNHYRRGAQRRGYSFTLTLDEFQSIVSQSCLFCGESKQPRGIDRWDNSVGYVLDNCRPCCRPCNDMKRAMDGRAFVDQCQRIGSYTETIEQAEAYSEASQENLRWIP